MAALTERQTQQTQPRTWQWLSAPLLAFVITRVFVFGVVAFADSIRIDLYDDRYFASGDFFRDYVEAWHRWDTVWYVDIVENGYTYAPDNPRSTIAFFPLFPLAVSSLNPLLGGNTVLSGLVVSNLCLIGALIALYDLTTRKLGGGAAARTVFYLAAFPASVFLSAAYTESMYLLCIVLAFNFAERGRWLEAGLVGALSAATRVTGVLLMPALLLLWLNQRGGFLFQPASWRAGWRALWRDWKSVLPLALIPAGLVLFALAAWRWFGSPQVIFLAHRGWRQENSIQSLINDLNLLVNGQLWASYIMDTGFIALTLLLIAPIWRRLGAAYGLYIALVTCLPILSGVMSFTRYVSVMFPVFMLLGMWGARRWLDVPLRIISLVLLPIFTILFVKWIFLG